MQCFVYCTRRILYKLLPEISITPGNSEYRPRKFTQQGLRGKPTANCDQEIIQKGGRVKKYRYLQRQRSISQRVRSISPAPDQTDVWYVEVAWRLSCWFFLRSKVDELQ